MSSDKVRLNGMELPGISPEVLTRSAKLAGYTDPEILEVLRLLQTRKFVDLNQRQNLLFRTVDAIDDLRDAILEQINSIEKQKQEITAAIPDFEPDLYSLSKIQRELADAKERDELENIRINLRQLQGNLTSFASSRCTAYREKLQSEQNLLLELIRQGIPPWLGREFAPGPLQDLLEKRNYSATTYGID